MNILKLSSLLIAMTITSASTSNAVDEQQYNTSLKACHDYVWSIPEFKNLPDAAIQSYLGNINGDIVQVYWIIDQNNLNAVGSCQVNNKSGQILDTKDFRESWQKQ